MHIQGVSKIHEVTRHNFSGAFGTQKQRNMYVNMGFWAFYFRKCQHELVIVHAEYLFMGPTKKFWVRWGS
jgi:hypothetical protein